jgi:hypothetical protein
MTMPEFAILSARSWIREKNGGYAARPATALRPSRKRRLSSPTLYELDPGMTDVEALSYMWKPHDARLMRAYPVSRPS